MALLSVTGLAGCLSDDAPPVGLGAVEITSRREDPIDVRVRITRAGELRYDDRHRLDGREQSQIDGTTIVEEWMGDRVPYEVRVDADGYPTETYATSDATEFVSNWGDNDCYRTKMTLNPDDIDTLLGWSESCEFGE